MSVVVAPASHFYLAYLGRPRDDYSSWTGQLSSGYAFASSPEYAQLLSSQGGADGLAQEIDSVYLRLFNRHAEAAGTGYWSNEVASGRLSRDDLAIGILQGAQNDDAKAVQNKLAAIDAFVAALDTAVERTGYSGSAAADAARAFVQNVGSDAASLAAAVASTDAAVAVAVAAGTPPGLGFTLTQGVDTVTPVLNTTANGVHAVPSSGNDVFYATDAGALGPGDDIDGGGGNDWLIVTGGADTSAATVRNFEQVLIFDASSSVDLSGVDDDPAIELEGGSTTVTGARSTSLFWIDGGYSFSIVLADRQDPSARLVIERFAGAIVTAPEVQSIDISGWEERLDPSLVGKLVASGLRELTVHTAPAVVGLSAAHGVGPVEAPAGLQLHLVGSGTVRGEQLPTVAAMDVFVEESAMLVANVPANVRSVVIASDRGSSLKVGIGSNDTVLVDFRTGGQVDATESGAGSRVLGGAGHTEVFGGAGFDSFTFGTGESVFFDRPIDFKAATADQLVAAADDIFGWGQGKYAAFAVLGDANTAAQQSAPARPGFAHIDSGMATFDAADATLAQRIDAVAAAVSTGLQTAFFASGGDAYVFVSNGTAGVNPGDVLVRLAGVTDLSLLAFNAAGLYHGTQG